MPSIIGVYALMSTTAGAAVQVDAISNAGPSVGIPDDDDPFPDAAGGRLDLPGG
jgi:hypothetical protein